MIILAFLLWLLVGWGVGYLIQKVTGWRSAFWVTFLAIMLLPWTETVIGIYVANSWYAKFGRLMPEGPIEVPGLLLAMDRDSNHPSLADWLNTRGFEFAEVEYSEDVYETPSMLSGPGFYQFRSARSPVAVCATAGASGKPAGVFATGGNCFTYTRSDRPMSRYAYDSGPDPFIRSNVRVYCIRLVDLLAQQDAARSCSVAVDGLFGIFVKGFSSPAGITEVLATVQPQSGLSN